MKSRFLIISAVLLVLSACSKPGLPKPVLTADKEEVTVKSYTNSAAFTLSWDLLGGNADISRTFIQFSSGKEFIKVYVASSSDDSYVVTYRDLQKMQGTFGSTGDYDLYVRLLIEGEDVTSEYSNKLTIRIDLP